MDETTNPSAEAAATDFAQRLVSCWQSALADELLGVYLMGSLAHGGFTARYSDIDIAVTTGAGVPQPVLDRVRGEAVALSSEWGPKLSVFWADRRFELGRFPALDRIDYLDHARALMEREAVRPPRPSLEEVREYLAGAPLARWMEAADRFAGTAVLEPKDRKAYLRALLYPARFCYSWITGRMGSNDDAVAFLARTPPPGLDIALIARALACRRADADPDALFAARTQLPSQIDACGRSPAESPDLNRQPSRPDKSCGARQGGPLTPRRAAMTRIVSIVLAVAVFAGAAAPTASAMHINMSAPRISGGIAGGGQAFTPRPFNRMPDVPIPIGTHHGPIKHAKPASKDFCEAIYQCCIKSGGRAVGCCNAYNDDKFCPY